MWRLTRCAQRPGPARPDPTRPGPVEAAPGGVSDRLRQLGKLACLEFGQRNKTIAIGIDLGKYSGRFLVQRSQHCVQIVGCFCLHGHKRADQFFCFEHEFGALPVGHLFTRLHASARIEFRTDHRSVAHGRNELRQNGLFCCVPLPQQIFEVVYIQLAVTVRIVLSENGIFQVVELFVDLLQIFDGFRFLRVPRPRACNVTRFFDFVEVRREQLRPNFDLFGLQRRSGGFIAGVRLESALHIQFCFQMFVRVVNGALHRCCLLSWQSAVRALGR